MTEVTSSLGRPSRQLPDHRSQDAGEAVRELCRRLATPVRGQLGDGLVGEIASRDFGHLLAHGLEGQARQLPDEQGGRRVVQQGLGNLRVLDAIAACRVVRGVDGEIAGGADSSASANVAGRCRGRRSGLSACRASVRRRPGGRRKFSFPASRTIRGSSSLSRRSIRRSRRCHDSSSRNARSSSTPGQPRRARMARTADFSRASLAFTRLCSKSRSAASGPHLARISAPISSSPTFEEQTQDSSAVRGQGADRLGLAGEQVQRLDDLLGRAALLQDKSQVVVIRQEQGPRRPRRRGDRPPRRRGAAVVPRRPPGERRTRTTGQGRGTLTFTRSVRSP